MKKLTAILLALMLALALCACNNTESKKNDDEPKTESNEEQTKNNIENETEKSDDKAEEPVNEQETANDEEAASEFTRGTVTDNTYESKYLGLGIKLDDTWTFSSDEDLEALMGIAADLMEDDKKAAWLEAVVINDMMAMTDTGNNVVVTYEKNIPSVLETLSMDTVVNNALASIESSYADMGVTDITSEKIVVNIDGTDFNALKVHVNFMGVDMYQSMIITKCHSHVASITVTSMGEDILDSIISNMYIIK